MCECSLIKLKKGEGAYVPHSSFASMFSPEKEEVKNLSEEISIVVERNVYLVIRCVMGTLLLSGGYSSLIHVAHMAMKMLIGGRVALN